MPVPPSLSTLCSGGGQRVQAHRPGPQRARALRTCLSTVSTKSLPLAVVPPNRLGKNPRRISTLRSWASIFLALSPNAQLPSTSPAADLFRSNDRAEQRARDRTMCTAGEQTRRPASPQAAKGQHRACSRAGSGCWREPDVCLDLCRCRGARSTPLLSPRRGCSSKMAMRLFKGGRARRHQARSAARADARQIHSRGWGRRLSRARCHRVARPAAAPGSAQSRAPRVCCPSQTQNG